MADVNANIGVNIDTSDALAQLKSLQRQISQFHASIAKSSEAAALAQRDLQRNFLNSVNALGTFSAELRTVKTTSESFTTSLEKNKLSMREYFRYAGASTKTFGRLFKSEYDTIGKVAEDRVKKLQTQYIKMGRDATGAMKAIAIIPNELDLDNFSTQTQIAAQKQALFNQLMKQGSTNLLNFGKNTQWAGRQLMVGFTIPLMAVGSAAAKTFMDMEQQALKFRKVYGDLFTPQSETEDALKNIEALGREFTKYGIAVSSTVGLAAEAAAAGFQGIDLQRQTTEATRLSVLGQIDAQQALETTIALQNAFATSSAELADQINFLNAVENQTVTSLDDITTAIPKVAPVIKQLGGDVKDLAFFITAMKEGGINASEGANALKSGLASLINPTSRARDMLQGLGIDIVNIVNKNKGDLKATVIGFAQALDTLAPLERARAIEQMFGKFQFARLSTLFSNVTRDGTQAARVLDLAGASVSELANLSEQELGKTAESAMMKFKGAVEDLKVAIVPVGEAFLKAVTPIIEFVSKISEKFANLSEGTKKAITVLVTVVGGLGPVLLMTFGLLANGVANIIKLFLTLRNGYQRLTGGSQYLAEQTQYLTSEQIDAAAAAHSLNQAHATLTQQFTVENTELAKLIATYQAATTAAAKFAAINPGMMIPPRTKKYAQGVVSVPGSGNKDTVPAMLTPGEAVIPAAMAKKYAPLINAMIAGNIPGYMSGKKSGSFTTSVSKVKEDIGLYKAPSVIRPQTVSNTWSTMQAEIDAMTQAAEDFLREMGYSSKQIANKVRQLVQKQASHITEQIQQIEVAGEVIDVKLWNADNLITDFGGINNYLNSIHKITKSLSEDQISRLASDLNMSIEEFKQELTLLEENIHPTTRSAAKVLKSIAGVGSESKDETLAYQSKTVVAGMDVRLEGDFYETVQDRAYDVSKDVKSLEQVDANVNKLKIKILDSFNISDEVAKISGKNIQSLQNAWSQLSLEAKERLMALSGDVNAFTQALLNEAKEAGIAGFEVGESAVIGIKKGAKTASPSKDTIKTGEDIGKGLEIGMQSRKDEIEAVAGSVADTAITTIKKRRLATRPAGSPIVPGISDGGSQRTRRVAGRPQGPSDVPTGVLISKLQADIIAERKLAADLAKQQARAAEEQIAQQERLARAAEEEELVRQQSSARLGKLNNAIQGGSFALMSLSGVTQMFGGNMGKMSEVIFKLSGALFALQTVTQLLTQAKALELLQSRIAAGKQAMAFATYGTGLAAKSGLLGSLTRLGIGITNFLGPIGIATTVVSGLVVGFKLLSDVRKREIEAIEGLGNAAQLTDAKLKALGGVFGVVSTKSAFERGTTAKQGEIQVASQTRSQLETLKQDKGFQDAFAKDINALKGATDNQAKLIFDSLAIDLKGKGYAAEQIQTIITALQEEAGKTNFKFDVKSIDVSTKEGQARMAQNVKKLTNSLSKNLTDGLSTVYRQVYDPKQQKWIVQPFVQLSKGAKKNLNLVSKSITSMFAGLSGQLESGVISAEQFNSSFENISKTISAMPKAQALVLMESLLKSLPAKLRESANGIGNVSNQLLLLKAQAAGVAVTAEIITAMITVEKASGPNAGGRIAKAKGEITEFEEKIKTAAEAYKKLTAAFNEGTVTGTNTGNDKQLSAAAKLTIARLQKELDLLKTKRDRINETNDAIKRQFDYQQRLMDLQKSAVEAKIRGDFIGATMLSQAKAFETKEFNRETESIALDKRITALENRISALQNNARVTKAEQALSNSKGLKRATGGFVSGPGTSKSDSIPAMLSDKEYVIQASAVKKYGVDFFDQLNAKKIAADKSTKKQNFFQRYVSSLTKAQDKTPFFGSRGMSDVLGVGALLRKITGQGRSGDTLNAALMPLNFLGMGSGSTNFMKVAGKATDVASGQIAGKGSSFLAAQAQIAATTSAKMARVDKEALAKIGKNANQGWQEIQNARIAQLAKKYPDIDKLSVQKFNEIYAKEFYGLGAEESMAIFKGDVIDAATAKATWDPSKASYFSRIPDVAAAYSDMLRVAKPSQDKGGSILASKIKISSLTNKLGEGIDLTSAQGMGEFPIKMTAENFQEVMQNLVSYTPDEFAKLQGFESTGKKMGKYALDPLLGYAKAFGFANGGIARKYSIPSYGVGVDYVPKDTLAMVHKGERILTADENRSFGGSSINNTNNIYINGTDLNKQEIADEVMVRLERVQKRNNKSNMVGK